MKLFKPFDPSSIHRFTTALNYSVDAIIAWGVFFVGVDEEKMSKIAKQGELKGSLDGVMGFKPPPPKK